MAIHNGYDYNLQVFVVNGVVQQCGHLVKVDKNGNHCCNAGKYAGQDYALLHDSANELEVIGVLPLGYKIKKD